VFFNLTAVDDATISKIDNIAKKYQKA